MFPFLRGRGRVRAVKDIEVSKLANFLGPPDWKIPCVRLFFFFFRPPLALLHLEWSWCAVQEPLSDQRARRESITAPGQPRLIAADGRARRAL
jgi:hypothetical protein